MTNQCICSFEVANRVGWMNDAVFFSDVWENKQIKFSLQAYSTFVFPKAPRVAIIIRTGV